MNIELELINTTFESDVRSLVMAFYPGCRIFVKGQQGKKAAKHLQDAGRDPFDRKQQPELSGRRLKVETQGQKTTLALCKMQKTECGPAAGDIDLVLCGTSTFTEPEEMADDRLRRKSLLKRELYKLLSADTKRELPWGTLTGIRPTKLPLSMLQEGRLPEEIAAHLKEEYYISDEKIRLSMEIAVRELQLVGGHKIREGYSLYVGIPFCPSTCAYCSFTSFPLAMWKPQTDAYLDAVEKELDFIAGYNHGRRLDSVYIGGGTPTTLAPAQLERLCGMIMDRFPMEHVREWSVEAGRPDSITKEKLLALRKFPVTRISINPQTMKEETLKLIGRRHTVAQTIEAFHLARACGFDNINMDLILGLPDETQADVEQTLERIAQLAPDSLTVHALAHKRAARMTTEREVFAHTTSTDTQQLHALVEKTARRMGLLPYYLYRQKNMAGNLENVGYAKEGKFCLYNILIMEKLQSIFAAGAGASTKLVLPDGSERRAENVKNVGEYMERIDEMIGRKREVLT